MQGGEIRRISVVMPMLNEADHIAGIVADLAAQDWEGELEVFAADGGSTDGSVALLERAAAEAAVSVTVLPNPRRLAVSGLNVCIPRATGDLIVRLDCHSRYPPDYVRRCALAAEETGGWNVGGIVIPRGRTPMERAVACAMDSPFGGIGWTRHRDVGRVEADTVSFGAFRPFVFERLGLYDETIAITEVEELNTRIRQAGGKVIYDPAIKPYYIPRGTWLGVYKQYWGYGRWKVPVMLKHKRVISLRAIVPVGFLCFLLLLAVLAVFTAAARWALAGVVTLYLLGALVFGILALRACRQPRGLLPRVVASFPVFHFSYGIGMTQGWLAALLHRG